MGAATTIGAAAAGLVLGVVLTLAVWSPSAPSGSGPSAANLADASAAGDGTDGRAPRATPHVATEPAVAPRDAAAQRAASAVDPELPAKVRATIRGRALLADGAPVQGATVRATVLLHSGGNAPREAGPPPRPSEEDRVEAARKAARWDAATTCETVTDAAGEFELTGLREATYQMAAWAAGMDLRPAGSTWAARPGGSFDFRAVARFPVDLDVVHPGGAMPRRVEVTWHTTSASGARGSALWHADSRTVYIDAGEWTVAAAAPDEELTADPVPVRVGPSVPSAPVRLRLHGAPAIVGRVVVPESEPWGDLRVVAVRHDGEGMAPDAELAAATSQTLARAPDYAFRMAGVEPGTYTVAVSMDGRTMLDRTTVTVGEGPSSCSLTMPAQLGDRAVRVRVTGPGDARVEDAKFALEVRRAGTISMTGPGTISPASDGSWLVPLTPDSLGDVGGPGVQWTLVVSSARLGERRVPFVRGRESSLDVSYTEPGTVRLTVAGYDAGRDAGRVSVALVPAGADTPAGPIMRSRADAGLDERGGRTFEPVAPGAYDVDVWMAIEGSRGLRVASERISVRSGEQAVSVDLPPVVDAVIAASGLAAGDRIELTCARAPGNYYFSLTARVDDRGEARLPRLPAGDYVVAALFGTERREMRVALSSSGTYAFSPGPLDGLDVTIDDPDGGLARAGFRTGDVVCAIDGHPFGTAYQARMLASAAREKESIAVTVLRGGRETGLTVPPALLTGFVDVGGHWEPVQR